MPTQLTPRTDHPCSDYKPEALDLGEPSSTYPMAGYCPISEAPLPLLDWARSVYHNGFPTGRRDARAFAEAVLRAQQRAEAALDLGKLPNPYREAAEALLRQSEALQLADLPMGERETALEHMRAAQLHLLQLPAPTRTRAERNFWRQLLLLPDGRVASRCNCVQLEKAPKLYRRKFPTYPDKDLKGNPSRQTIDRYHSLLCRKSKMV